MRRVLATVAVLAVAALAVLGTGASSDDGSSKRYWLELDNAFGLIEGGDMKIAGVRAGRIGELKLDRKTHRALVELEVTQEGFGSIRTDVRCESRPQSLIGEYFVDCQPGTAREELPEGTTIPVERTSSTVAPDLVNNVLRRPYRERLSIIVNELGAAVAGNAKNLNDAVRRASPGLRETNKVLKILADQNEVISDLIVNADTVISDLSDNREDVGRFVVEARDTARASAERRDDIAAGFRRLPGFLSELGPTMRQLGRVADEQRPALRTLQLASDDIERFFGNLGPFADASLPAFRALGEASRTGSRIVAPARETVRELDRFTKGTPELAKNLAIVLEHLDNRDFSVENDPRSPGGKGYTGLEALLQYVYDQVLSINVYDQSNHILKVAPFESHCANYADIERAQKAEEGHLLEQCGAALGPRSAGLNYPDTTRPDGMPLTGPPPEPAAARTTRDVPMEVRRHRPAEPKPATALADPHIAPAPEPEKKAEPPRLSDVIPGAPPVTLPSAPVQSALELGTRDRRTQDRLLSYLLAP